MMSTTTIRGYGTKFATALIWCAVVAIVVHLNYDKLYSMSVDVAHHGVLVERLMENWDLAADDPSLGEMNTYPRGAHLLASIPARWFDSPVAGMHVISLISLVLLWGSILYSFTPLHRRVFERAIFAFSTIVILNFLVIRAELFGSELVSSYFYAQLVAQASGILAIALALRGEWRGTDPRLVVALLCLVAWLLTGVHLLPAIELLCTAAIIFALHLVSTYRRRPMRTIGIGLVLFGSTTVAIVIHPAFAAMRSISEHNGALPIHHVSGLGGMSLLAAVVMLGSFALLIHSFRSVASDRYGRMMARYFGAFGLSIAALCILQIMLYVMAGKGSPYACYKYIYGLNTMIAVQVALAAGLWTRTPDDGRRGAFRHVAFAAVAVLLACISTFPFNAIARTSDISQAFRIARQFAQDAPAPSPGQSNYAMGITGITSVGDYFVSIGPLRAPRAAPAYDVLEGRYPKETDAVAQLLTSSGSQWDVEACRHAMAHHLAIVDGACMANFDTRTCEGLVDFSKRGITDAMTNGFSNAEIDGRWGEGAVATFTCKLPRQRPSQVVLHTQALVTPTHDQRMQISVNGTVVENVLYTAVDPTRIVVLAVPADSTSDLSLRFDFPDAASPAELRMNADLRKLSVKFHSVRFN